MCKEDCENYSESNHEVKIQYDKNKICRHFVGDKDSINQVSNCRKYCSLELMKSGSQSFVRVHNRWRKR